MKANKILTFTLALVFVIGFAVSGDAWDTYGHMAVAYVAYQRLTPQAMKRANDLIKLNPNYGEWSGWVSANATQANKDRMIFMLAATWPDEIKSDPSYTSDGSANGNLPEGSPDPSANKGYPDKLRHKYWHFVDFPFTQDGTALPPLLIPNAQERIALFRGVLASGSDDALKSYDLTWLLHLVGDVHQPLHCATRVSNAHPDGDNGGNDVKLSGTPSQLHTFWDDLLGTGTDPRALLKPAMKSARKLAAADPALAEISDEKVWIAESFQAAQESVYQAPIVTGDGPFTPTSKYTSAATKLAKKRIALAGARLANLINNELK